MNKLKLDFKLEKSTTAEVFWQAIYKWLSKPNPLYSQARKTFIDEHKELSTFKVISNGKPGTLVSIDVRHDVQRSTLSVEIIEQRETLVRNINIFSSFYGTPRFSYEESVNSKSENFARERLDIPKFLKFSRQLINSSNLVLSVLPVVDEDGHFERNILKLERRYSGLANVRSITAQETESLAIQQHFIHPGNTLLLLNGNYCTAFEPKNITRLDWYILTRTNRRWQCNKKNALLRSAK